jgi:predicted enzyme related to lactoylglutathione lyase
MKTRVLTLVASLLATSVLAAAPTMHKPADVGVGRIAWFDISTTNLQKSRDFYSKLFGWTFNPVKGSDGAVEIVSRGVAIGTLRGANGVISSHNGVVYVQVTDIRQSCRKAADLGATIADGFPFNLQDGTGAICVVTDPAGHPVGMYSRTPIPGAPAAGTPGS